MISIISIDEEEKWDNIVKSFSDYDVYYLSSYVKGFQLHGDGDPKLIYFQSTYLKGINVVMLRDIANNNRFTKEIPSNTYFDITTPYGYGGLLIEGEMSDDAIEDLKREYSDVCNKIGIVSEFVRFHPMLQNNCNLDNFYDIVNLGSTISMDLSSKGLIWDNISSKNRNMIRKAQKSGTEVFWGRSPELIEDFKRLYKLTMDKDNAKDYYYFKDDFYNSILMDLKYNSMFFYAKYQNKVVSISLILLTNNKLHYHLSASDREYQNMAPTNLLLYEVANWGCENGFKTLHLGGGLGSQQDNLYKFKKAFNRNKENQFFIGKKIYNKETYNDLVSIRTMDNDFDKDSLYFPLYRS